MKILCAASLFLALGSAAEAQVEFNAMRATGQDIHKTVIADGIYQFTTMRDSYVREVNSVVVVNDSDVLVFDTGTRPSSARLTLAQIRKITGKPVRYVVNSHHHPRSLVGQRGLCRCIPRRRDHSHQPGVAAHA
jgi:alkyl sulfatase BDS1-like metallo-beta-lactamase superfamily hydrolase